MDARGPRVDATFSAAPAAALQYSLMSASELARKDCVPCRGGVPPLKGAALEQYALQLPRWTVKNEHHLHCAISFPDFRTALDFVNKVGELAEQQGHHPDIMLSWGHVEITIWTHKIDGLTESDFVLAAKIEQMAPQART